MIIKFSESLKLTNVLYIDMRTKDEFEATHIEGAINYEILTQDERKEVSINYNNSMIQEAYSKAYEYALPKLSGLLELLKLNKDKKIVFYCQRGGSRSSIVYDVFKGLVGYKIYKISGGYKSYRKFVNSFFENDIKDFEFNIVHGYSGSGKTNLLKSLDMNGFNTINFADIVGNTGSIFGDIVYKEKQMTQKRFEDILFNKLYFPEKKIFYFESEGKRLGQVTIRNEFFDAMSKGKRLLLETTLENRVNNLYEDYVVNGENFKSDIVIEKINKLRKRLSNDLADELINLIKEESYLEFIKIILVEYYDPFYKYSIDKYRPYDETVKYTNEKELLEYWSV